MLWTYLAFLLTSLSLFTFMHWRRKWQPTPVFLPGESQGRASLVGSHRVGHDWGDLAVAAAFLFVFVGLINILWKENVHLEPCIPLPSPVYSTPACKEAEAIGAEMVVAHSGQTVSFKDHSLLESRVAGKSKLLVAISKHFSSFSPYFGHPGKHF